MKTISCLSPLLCLLVLTACSGEPATDVTTTEEAGLAMSTGPDPVVARVDGTPLRRSDVIREAVSQGAIEEGGYLPVDDPVFVRITEELIDQRLLAIEARRRGLQDSQAARERIAVAEERILGNVLLETVIDEAVNEEAITRVYNEQASLSGRSDEVSARHILVNTREEIDAIKAELDAGADFAELAVLYSLDTATRMDGGDLGYFSRQSVLPEFSGVAFSTEVGQISDPFETPSGWHVLRVDSRRSAETPDLEEVRPGIVRFLTFEQIETLVRTLRDTIPVERIDLTASAPETADPSTDSDG
tara:strand:- start:1573 stop:2481 length:909 start_codon:yes stop_codon:yes gene_type:complete